MSDIKKFLDYEGVKHLWSKINMNDYPNNETLINVINAIDETKADRSELVQSDWNQNDETAADYMKNRPFYEDAEVLSLYDGYAYFANGLDTGYETFFDSPLGLQSGETYNVTINDETLSIVYEAGYTGICRLSFNGANASVVIYDEWALSDFEGECYLKIEKCSTTLKQLDEKYIPDTIARVEDIPEINYPVTSVNGQTGDVQINIPEQVQSDWTQTDETATNFIKNKPNEDDALALLAEVGFVEPVADADGSIYTDENGVIYTLI